MITVFSLVPCVVGPSAESRGHDSTLGALPVRFYSESSPKQDVPVGRCAQGR